LFGAKLQKVLAYITSTYDLYRENQQDDKKRLQTVCGKIFGKANIENPRRRQDNKIIVDLGRSVVGLMVGG
jgi:hypothetical protein